MFAAVHTAVGMSVAVTCQRNIDNLWISIPCAIIAALSSHILMDKLNEKQYGDIKENLIWESWPLGAYILCFIWLIITQQYQTSMFYLIGGLFGNLPDITDSYCYQIYYEKSKYYKKSKKKWWICHKSNWTYWYNCNLFQTKALAISSVLIIIFTTFVLLTTN